jgi:hypothetical protein
MSKLGRLKEESSTHQLDISTSTLVDTLEKLLAQFKLARGNGSITLFIHCGGIGGAEFTETKKIKSS